MVPELSEGVLLESCLRATASAVLAILATCIWIARGASTLTRLMLMLLVVSGLLVGSGLIAGGLGRVAETGWITRSLGEALLYAVFLYALTRLWLWLLQPALGAGWATTLASVGGFGLLAFLPSSLPISAALVYGPSLLIYLFADWSEAERREASGERARRRRQAVLSALVLALLALILILLAQWRMAVERTPGSADSTMAGREGLGSSEDGSALRRGPAPQPAAAPDPPATDSAGKAQGPLDTVPAPGSRTPADADPGSRSEDRSSSSGAAASRSEDRSSSPGAAASTIEGRSSNSGAAVSTSEDQGRPQLPGDTPWAGELARQVGGAAGAPAVAGGDSSAVGPELLDEWLGSDPSLPALAELAEADVPALLMELESGGETAQFAAGSTREEKDLARARDLEVRGNIFFTAAWERGLIIRRAPPRGEGEKLDTLVRLDTPGLSAGVDVVGRIAVLADYDSLVVVDLSKLEHPAILSRLVLPGVALDVELVGELAYVAAWDAGLHVVSLRDPEAPRLVSTREIPGGHVADVEVRIGRAYLASGEAGCTILDVRDAGMPRVIATISKVGFVRGVGVYGDRIWLAGYRSGVHLYDLTDPSRPVFLSRYETEGSALDVEIEGHVAHISAGQKGMWTVDYRSAGEPRLISTQRLTRAILAVRRVGQRIYVADGAEGVSILHLPSALLAGAEADSPRAAPATPAAGAR